MSNNDKKKVFSELLKQDLKKIKKIVQPKFVQPMLAILTTDYFSNKNWIYEHKFDGERCLVFKKNGKVRLLSRNNKLMNAEYPELVDEFTRQIADNFIIDGEIVAFNKKNISDFQLLQTRMHLRKTKKIQIRKAKIHIVYCIFDLLYVDGYDVRKLPLSSRKILLKKILKYNDILIFTQYISGDGIKYFDKACKFGWEGIIAKRFASEYASKRSRDWLKFKCIMKQELVVGGYTDPRRSRKYFGALLVGYYKNEKLIYAGKVGTGFSENVLEMLGKKLQKLQIRECPFYNYDESKLGVHWVKPILVAEFQFAQWTSNGKLRVGRYKGLRDDKEAKNVIKETPTIYKS